MSNLSNPVARIVATNNTPPAKDTLRDFPALGDTTGYNELNLHFISAPPTGIKDDLTSSILPCQEHFPYPHTTPPHEISRLGGGDIPLLKIDYYIAAPDPLHLGHAAFTSPHLGARRAITALADNIVLNSQWVIDPDQNNTDQHI